MYRRRSLGQTKLREQWLYHAETEAWFVPAAWERPELEKRIIKLFGGPPYRFLHLGDPVPARFITRKRKPLLDREYVHEFPTPNYSELGKNPHFIQTNSPDNALHWFWATGSIVEALRNSGEIPQSISSTAIEPHANLGTRALYVRMPIKEKSAGAVFPDPTDRIFLVHQKTRLLFTATVEKIFVSPRRSTGWAILSDISNNGTRVDKDE